jgi:hypothetical protein
MGVTRMKYRHLTEPGLAVVDLDIVDIEIYLAAS